jgi:hypothetical protein
MAKRKKRLLIGGSLNQTQIMYKIAVELMEDFDCYVSPFYVDGFVRFLADRGYMDATLLGGVRKKSTEEFLRDNRVNVDYRGESHDYDLVFIGTDVFIPRNILGKHIILVQEGMMVPENWVYHLVRFLRLPRFLANTAATGLSGDYRRFCVASDGFRELFLGKGVPKDKIAVTGIPNFDDLDKLYNNEFPHKGYVLAATSSLRENLKYENRRKFIQKVLKIADGRKVIFKLHPAENVERAVREIRKYAPGAMIYDTGDTDAMVANCDALVTKYSSVMLVGLGLGKRVFSDIDPSVAKSLTPIQNAGRSAKQIAEIGLDYLC